MALGGKAVFGDEAEKKITVRFVRVQAIFNGLPFRVDEKLFSKGSSPAVDLVGDGMQFATSAAIGALILVITLNPLRFPVAGGD